MRSIERAEKMQKSRKKIADYFLYDCGLLDELKKYGEVHMIGSYRMDMMAWNDLDIDVDNAGMSQEKLYQLTSFIVDKFHPTWYEAKQEINADGGTVWFHGFETMITGELWNFDIWFLNKAKIEDTAQYCDAIAQKTSPEQKARIVAIKEALINKNMYSFEQYRSVDVYKAVVGMGISDIDEFLRRYDVERDRDRD